MRREKTGDHMAWLSLRSFAKQTEMEVSAISFAVRGFHAYKDIWKPFIGDKLACGREKLRS